MCAPVRLVELFVAEIITQAVAATQEGSPASSLPTLTPSLNSSQGPVPAQETGSAGRETEAQSEALDAGARKSMDMDGQAVSSTMSTCAG